MTDGRFLDAVYCDDIRHETGNKLTLVGCYGSDLLVQHLPPVTLPKLCVYVRVFTPIDHPFERLAIRVRLADAVIAELPMPLSSRNRETDVTDARWILLVGAMSLSPFFVERECKLRIEAESENGLLEGPALRIRIAQPQKQGEEKVVPQSRGKTTRRKR